MEIFLLGYMMRDMIFFLCFLDLAVRMNACWIYLQVTELTVMSRRKAGSVQTGKQFFYW